MDVVHDALRDSQKKSGRSNCARTASLAAFFFDEIPPVSKTFFMLASILVFLSQLVCSCSTGRGTVDSTAALPAEMTIRGGAGSGGHLFVMLHLDGGKDLPFGVDTGAPVTTLPSSVEPELGRCLGTRTFDNFGTKLKQRIYKAPKIYAGNIPLKTDNRVTVSRHSFGILGMDCLRNYCIQIDFQTGKLRFLDPDKVEVSELGKGFRLTGRHYAYIHSTAPFVEKGSKLLVDTGHPLDGILPPSCFNELARKQQAQPVVFLISPEMETKTNLSGVVSFPTCAWNGNSYTDVVLEKGEPTLIGLRFLARHLVTFDFPSRTMYLKQTSVGPLKHTDVHTKDWAEAHHTP